MSVYWLSDGEEVVLERWSIRQSDEGTRHFVGFDVLRGDGRVSTPIMEFDPATRNGSTRSGSKYRLLGRAGRDSDAEYVWRVAAKTWGFTTWTDITPDIVPDWRQARSLAQIASGQSSTGGIGESLLEDKSTEPDGTADPAVAGDSRIVCFRAKACQGEYIDPNEPLVLVSEVCGAGIVDATRLADKVLTQEFLMLVRSLLETMARGQQPIDGASLMKPAMTVWIARLASLQDMAGEVIARFDLVIDDESAYASVHIQAQPRVDIGPLALESDDGLWETVIRFLPVGDLTVQTLPGEQ